MSLVALLINETNDINFAVVIPPMFREGRACDLRYYDAFVEALREEVEEDEIKMVKTPCVTSFLEAVNNPDKFFKFDVVCVRGEEEILYPIRMEMITGY